MQDLSIFVAGMTVGWLIVVLIPAIAGKSLVILPNNRKVKQGQGQQVEMTANKGPLRIMTRDGRCPACDGSRLFLRDRYDASTATVQRECENCGYEWRELPAKKLQGGS